MHTCVFLMSNGFLNAVMSLFSFSTNVGRGVGSSSLVVSIGVSVLVIASGTGSGTCGVLSALTVSSDIVDAKNYAVTEVVTNPHGLL